MTTTASWWEPPPPHYSLHAEKHHFWFIGHVGHEEITGSEHLPPSAREESKDTTDTTDTSDLKGGTDHTHTRVHVRLNTLTSSATQTGSRIFRQYRFRPRGAVRVHAVLSSFSGFRHNI